MFVTDETGYGGGRPRRRDDRTAAVSGGLFVPQATIEGVGLLLTRRLALDLPLRVRRCGAGKGLLMGGGDEGKVRAEPLRGDPDAVGRHDEMDAVLARLVVQEGDGPFGVPRRSFSWSNSVMAAAYAGAGPVAFGEALRDTSRDDRLTAALDAYSARRSPRDP